MFLSVSGMSYSGGGRGCSPWKGVQGRAALKAPFSRSLSSSLRPPFQHVSVLLGPPFQQKSQFFTKLAVLEPKFTKISVTRPQILQNFSSKASNWAKIYFFKPLFFPKNQFFKPLFFMPDRPLNPLCDPSGAHQYQKWKLSTSRGHTFPS